MAVSKYTLANALAYLAITGGKRALHINTSIAMHPYHELEEYKVRYGDDMEPLTLHRYKLTEEGMELAKTSRLWKAHQQLTEMGFKVQGDRRMKPYHIPYTRWTDDVRDDAFTGAHGRVYAQDHAAKTEKAWEFNMIGQHKNG